MHTLGVQEHWRATTDRKRVFLLTRSAFLGQQRVGATVWSGDVYGTYWGLTHQVSAGLNFALSGYPYWTTDIGGYWRQRGSVLEDPKYQELYARWFEYGAFCPIFRTHGHRPHNELWTYNLVEPTLLNYDKLRYRLMPYIYSLAWRVHNEDYTIQRPLVMDWRQRSKDAKHSGSVHVRFGHPRQSRPGAGRSASQRLFAAFFLLGTTFGRALPLAAGKRSRQMRHSSTCHSSFARVRSFRSVRRSSMQIKTPGDPIELRVYSGADGRFDLYESHRRWRLLRRVSTPSSPYGGTTVASTLTIGARKGSIPSDGQRRTLASSWSRRTPRGLDPTARSTQKKSLQKGRRSPRGPSNDPPLRLTFQFWS